MIYKGFEIAQHYDLNYYGTDVDADYDHDGDGYQQCSGMPSQGPCKTADEVKAQIDAYLEEAA